jgi:predicted protein tyrosine phosphatase
VTQLLFVCSRNRARSLTAEIHFRNRPGFDVRSAGTEPSARIRVTSGLLNWADAILVMERRHADILREAFPEELAGKPMINLRIPDDFEPHDPDLITSLESAVSTHFPGLL